LGDPVGLLLVCITRLADNKLALAPVTAFALLYHMYQFMGQQFPAGCTAGGVFPLTEENISTGCKRASIQFPVELVGFPIGMGTNMAEIVIETLLKKRTIRPRDRLSHSFLLFDTGFEQMLYRLVTNVFLKKKNAICQGVCGSWKNSVLPLINPTTFVCLLSFAG
jgi:hypothetical protein